MMALHSVCSTRYACVWDIVNGQLLLQLKHGDDPIVAGILSHDEQNVVSIDAQGILRMWEVPQGKTEDSVSPLFQSKIEVDLCSFNVHVHVLYDVRLCEFLSVAARRQRTLAFYPRGLHISVYKTRKTLCPITSPTSNHREAIYWSILCNKVSS